MSRKAGKACVRCLLFALIFGLAGALPLYGREGHCAAALAREQAPLKLGICLYNDEDTFIYSMYQSLLQEAEKNGAEVLMRDAANDQNRQNDQLEELLKEGVDALIVNPVDRTTSLFLIQMAMRYNVPTIFVNREPLAEDLAVYDKAYYVGIDPAQQGTLGGTLAAEYFQTHESADKNGDGLMQLVILKGEPGHQDAELRTIYAQKALQDAGVKVERLGEETALWQKSLGQERMAALLSSYGSRIECVISNNDDMALGAIDALKAAGYFDNGQFIPVLGVDGTEPARAALLEGTMYATVFNNGQAQAEIAVRLASLLARGEAVDEKSFPYAMKDKIIYIESTQLVTEAVE
ncbi:MAG: galactose ABC transporter substrate-binding protein [Clostridia bacterium]